MKDEQRKEFVVTDITPIVNAEHLEKDEEGCANIKIKRGAMLVGLYVISLIYLLAMRYYIENDQTFIDSIDDIKAATNYMTITSILCSGVGAYGVGTLIAGFAKKYPAFANMLKTISGYNYVKKKFGLSDSNEQLDDENIKRR